MRDGSQTRKKLERCAMGLFVTKGIHATTIKDIANEAQVAEGTMYRHWKSKDELAQSLFIHAYETVMAQMGKLIAQETTFKEQMKLLTHMFCKQYDEDPVLFQYLLLTQHYQKQYLSNEKQNAHYFVVHLINQAMHRNELPKGDPHVYAAIAMGIVLQAALSRVYGRIHRKMQEDEALLEQAIMRALSME